MGRHGPFRLSPPLRRRSPPTIALVLLLATGWAAAPGHAPSPPAPGDPPVSLERAPARAAPSPAPALSRFSVEETAAGSVNWPTYMGSPEHTAANLLERTIAPSNASELRMVWSVATNGSVRSSPIVANGTVYWGGWNGYEYAASAATGTVAWSRYLGTDPSCYPRGIESTPAISEGSLYLGAPNGSWDGLNATTGRLEWSEPVGGPTARGYYDWASALVFHDALYVGQASCDDSPLVVGAVLELNLTGPPSTNHTWTGPPPGELGTTVWTTPTGDPLSDTIWVSTGNDDGAPQPYAQSIVALNASTLAVRGSWQVPNVVGTDSDFGSTPTMVDSPGAPPLVVATNKNGVLVALNRSNVTDPGWGPVWRVDTGGGWSGAAFNGTTLFAAGGNSTMNTGAVYAIDPWTGTVLWRTSTGVGYPFASLTYADGVVFSAGSQTASALDAGNGRVLWNFTAPSGETIDGEPVVANGRLYLGSGTPNGTVGHLFAFGIPFAASANATPANRSSPSEPRFTASATGGLTPYSYAWTFDDGGTASGPFVHHLFVDPGAHWGNVTISDAAGDSVSFQLPVRTSAPAPPLDLTSSWARVGSACSTGEATVRFVAYASN
ncbi:MAG TPA: PQQ-binding-like beta-propeller repeat protein, partial [Thermoplasmata archaeon]|nr:PQQ-binding-like beta-propeller repeat protein [Thermoplasmata archaeon]